MRPSSKPHFFSVLLVYTITTPLQPYHVTRIGCLALGALQWCQAQSNLWQVSHSRQDRLQFACHAWTHAMTWCVTQLLVIQQVIGWHWMLSFCEIECIWTCTSTCLVFQFATALCLMYEFDDEKLRWALTPFGWLWTHRIQHLEQHAKLCVKTGAKCSARSWASYQWSENKTLKKSSQYYSPKTILLGICWFDLLVILLNLRKYFYEEQVQRMELGSLGSQTVLWNILRNLKAHSSLFNIFNFVSVVGWINILYKFLRTSAAMSIQVLELWDHCLSWCSVWILGGLR